jgi:asparagine synthase (glutamine-hydrolysing)
MGLELPHSLWLMREMRPLVGRYLSPERIGRTGFLSHAAVERLWDEHQSGRRDNGRALWSIITLMVWFELFVESNDYKRHVQTARAGASVDAGRLA